MLNLFCNKAASLVGGRISLHRLVYSSLLDCQNTRGALRNEFGDHLHFHNSAVDPSERLVKWEYSGNINTDRERSNWIKSFCPLLLLLWVRHATHEAHSRRVVWCLRVHTYTFLSNIQISVLGQMMRFQHWCYSHFIFGIVLVLVSQQNNTAPQTSSKNWATLV